MPSRTLDRTRARSIASANRKGIAGTVIIGIVSVALGSLIILPIVRMLIRLFWVDGRFSIEAFDRALAIPGLWEMLGNTLFVVIVSGSLAMVVAALFAWVNERTDAKMGWLSQVMPVLPILMPPVAMVVGWVLLLSPTAGSINSVSRSLFGLDASQGPLNIYTMYGLIWLYVLELIPYAYLVLSSALRNLDPSLEEASRMSGSGPLSTVFKITLPAVKPQLASAALLVLVMGFALFSAPSIVGTTARIEILSAKIVQLLHGGYPPKTAEAVVLGTVILVVIFVGWTISNQISKKGRYAVIGGKGSKGGRVPLGRLKLPIRIIMVGYLLCAIILPLAALIFVSLQRYWQPSFSPKNFGLDAYRSLFVTNEIARSALMNSVLLGIVGATIGVAVSFFVGMLVRRRPSSLARSLDGLTKLPAAMSHIVLALAILLMFGGAPFYLNGTLVILLIGYTVIYLPQGSIAANSTINQVGDELFEASYMAGATEIRTLRKIAFPLMVPGLAGGWVLLYALMAGDLTASVLLSSTSTPTAGATIMDQFQNGTFPLIAALALALTVATGVVVLTVLKLTHARFTQD